MFVHVSSVILAWMRRLVLAPLLPFALTLFACGSGDPETPAERVPGDADPAAVAVIEEWSRTLRQGDVEGAAALFAVPSVAENGPAVVEIEDRDDARLFNASLPCGARLIRATGEGDFTVATFRLSERPGPGVCGAGSGGEARTAFVIEDGEIVEWRRVGIGGEQAPSDAA